MPLSVVVFATETAFISPQMGGGRDGDEEDSAPFTETLLLSRIVPQRLTSRSDTGDSIVVARPNNQGTERLL